MCVWVGVCSVCSLFCLVQLVCAMFFVWESAYTVTHMQCLPLYAGQNPQDVGDGGTGHRSGGIVR